jgi:hypothetical protein
VCRPARCGQNKLHYDTVRQSQSIRLASGDVQVNELTLQLSAMRADRDRLAADAETQKQKHRQRKKTWADDRAKLVRCLDAQTRATTTQLQDIARQIGPGGSLRQSLDAAIGRATSFSQLPPRFYTGPSTGAPSSMCSSPMGSAFSTPFCLGEVRC